jgi:hypothetical protein
MLDKLLIFTNIAIKVLDFSGQGQLTVKGSSNRMLPRFQEPDLS